MCSLFPDDFEKNYMFTSNGFNLELNDDYLDVYLKLIVLLYADDTVIFFQIRISVRFCF